jgi:hypothetical protein
MIFIEWWLVRRFAICIVMLVASGLCFRNAEKWKLPDALRGLSMPVGVLGGLFLFATIAATAIQTYSKPVYSPGGDSAVRIRVAGFGSFNGTTEVELFTAHGFNSVSIFSGGIDAIEPQNIHWAGDSYLTLEYSGSMLRCESTSEVLVRCVPSAH